LTQAAYRGKLWGMRTSRIKVEGRSAVYHCITRCVGGERLLDDRAKEVLRKQMHQMAKFCGVKVLAYCLMSNHFHVLVRVPERSAVTDAQLLERFGVLYHREAERIKALEMLLNKGGEEADVLRQKLLARMGDVSLFMKELKQRFSIWYNRSHKRYGTLWAERFKSVLVEDGSHSLPIVAAYIDLNPVRAGMVKDPKGYRFSSYGELMGGSKRFAEALGHILDTRDQQWAEREYRKLLYLFGASQNRKSQLVMDEDKVRKVVEADGKVSRAELLRLRVRYFSDGMVLGSQAFVEQFFVEHRHLFGSKRKHGARPMLGLKDSGLAVIRDLRKQVVG